MNDSLLTLLFSILAEKYRFFSFFDILSKFKYHKLTLQCTIKYIKKILSKLRREIIPESWLNFLWIIPFLIMCFNDSGGTQPYLFKEDGYLEIHVFSPHRCIRQSRQKHFQNLGKLPAAMRRFPGYPLSVPAESVSTTLLQH